MTTWHDTDSAHAVWRDAPVDDETLEELLEVARISVVAYAPALPEPEEGQEQDIPVHYRWAQLQQAQNIWNAWKSDPRSAEDEFRYTPYPLDRWIKQTLRPRKGVPSVR